MPNEAARKQIVGIIHAFADRGGRKEVAGRPCGATEDVVETMTTAWLSRGGGGEPQKSPTIPFVWFWSDMEGGELTPFLPKCHVHLQMPPPIIV